MLPRVNVISTENDQYLLFSTNDHISNHLYLNGKWEELLFEITKLFCIDEKEPVIFDIGANLGAYAIPVAKHIASSKGIVYCFEPQRIIYYQLCGNVFLNRLENIHAYNNAICEKNKTISIPELNYNETTNIGSFSLNESYRVNRNENHVKENSMQNISGICLDSFNEKMNITLIKLDVEGYELDVIKGAHEFLKKNNYPPILFECWNTDWFKEQKEKLFFHLDEIGYQIFHLGNDDYIAQNISHKKTFQFIQDGNKLSYIKIK